MVLQILRQLSRKILKLWVFFLQLLPTSITGKRLDFFIEGLFK
jgi:hypothetical protein